MRRKWGYREQLMGYTNFWNHINSSTSEKPLPLNSIQTITWSKKMGKVGGMQWTEFNHSFQKALLFFFQICTSCWHVSGKSSVPLKGQYCKWSMHLGVHTGTDAPQQKTKTKQNKNSVLKISRIVGIKVEKPFPLQIIDINNSVMLTTMYTYPSSYY